MRCSIRRVQLVGRPVEREHGRRQAHLLAPEPVGVGAQARAAVRQLERPDDALAVVRVDRRCCPRIAERERPRARRAPPSSYRCSLASADHRIDARRESQVDEHGAQIKPAATDRIGGRPRSQLVDRRVCQGRVLGDGATVVERPDADEAVRGPLRLGGRWAAR